MKLYPLKFEPIVKKMIWGSESWEISCRPNEMSIIENGEFAGTRFDEFILKNPAAILGEDCAKNSKNPAAIPGEDFKKNNSQKNFFENFSFPLLVKIIDAREILSVQVHPDDAYAAKKRSTDTGKSECWYILKPPTDGFLIVGLKNGVTREILAAAYENGTVERCLNRLHVTRGDIVKIPAGLIHALTPGAIIAEIQQNSDITYRLYDFNRTGADGNPRELHVKDALATIDFTRGARFRLRKTIAAEKTTSRECTFSREKKSRATVKHFLREKKSHATVKHFSLEKKIICATEKFFSDEKKFSIYTAVEGAAFFETREHSVFLPETRSVFIPAGLGEFTIRAQKNSATLLFSAPNCPTPHIIQ
ncbi:MAG: class I mannose-6-phosphate isomerase [Defluviitaleaceae bacterium]|nr:class I mannose-6-phosphate isomerase [Defluviitaleaceae bacterium]